MGRARLTDVRLLSRRLGILDGSERGRDVPARVRKMRIRTARRLRELGVEAPIQEKNVRARVLAALGDGTLSTSTIVYRTGCSPTSIRDLARLGVIVVVARVQSGLRSMPANVYAAAEHAHKFRKARG